MGRYAPEIERKCSDVTVVDYIVKGSGTLWVDGATLEEDVNEEDLNMEGL